MQGAVLSLLLIASVVGTVLCRDDARNAFLNQPVIPHGSPNMVDKLEPPEVAFASDALIDADILQNLRSELHDDRLYSVDVRRVLFGSLRPRQTLVMDLGAELQLPLGRYVIAIRKSAVDRFASGWQPPYRVTLRVTGIGLVDGNMVTYRRFHAAPISYAKNDSRGWLGCFYAKPSTFCRNRLMAKYRVSSPTQRSIYVSLQREDPFAALLWARIAATTTASFPTILCSAQIDENCASRAQFERRLGYVPTD
ncbi:MAG TPA: hypothetical protein VFB22_13730 [Candidatus Baltobacteraceae bacterium]|nr:hypothetical protein [Candidatus Baltobacteraceae bacterium]